jgi:hypothetical protein
MLQTQDITARSNKNTDRNAQCVCVCVFLSNVLELHCLFDALVTVHRKTIVRKEMIQLDGTHTKFIQRSSQR